MRAGVMRYLFSAAEGAKDNQMSVQSSFSFARKRNLCGDPGPVKGPILAFEHQSDTCGHAVLSLTVRSPSLSYPLPSETLAPSLAFLETRESSEM